MPNGNIDQPTGTSSQHHASKTSAADVIHIRRRSIACRVLVLLLFYMATTAVGAVRLRGTAQTNNMDSLQQGIEIAANDTMHRVLIGSDVQKLAPSDLTSNNQFGSAVSLIDGVAAVGANFQSTQRGKYSKNVCYTDK